MPEVVVFRKKGCCVGGLDGVCGASVNNRVNGAERLDTTNCVCQDGFVFDEQNLFLQLSDLMTGLVFRGCVLAEGSWAFGERCLSRVSDVGMKDKSTSVQGGYPNSR